MKKDKNSSNIRSEKVDVTISATIQIKKEENTNIECLEALPATIPSIKVVTDTDRTAFLEDDGGY